MREDPYSKLYGKLNWDAPKEPSRCGGCREIAGDPKAGAYPTALAHYEDILGLLPGPRTKVRILLLFLDPRPGEHHFRPANPLTPGSQLGEEDHRYFCLTPVAWRALELYEATGSPNPQWPCESTAPAFLRRYLGRGRAWSYDGFLAYFLYLFRPEDALITNLAKCHFGKDPQPPGVYRRCASLHLQTEVAELRPNLVLSFTSRIGAGKFLEQFVPALASVPRLTIFHPAARTGPASKQERFLKEVSKTNTQLSELGIDVGRLRLQWSAHADDANPTGTA